MIVMQDTRTHKKSYFHLSKSEIRKWGNLAIIGFLAIIYGLFLANLTSLEFKDRLNYLIFATDSDRILSNFLTKGILPALSNEPIWLLINMGLGHFLAPKEVVQAIIFFSAATTAYIALRADSRNIVWILVFFFLPQVIKNNIVHLRQGFAVAVFLLGWFSTNRNVRWFFVSLTPFIHAAFFIYILMIILVYLSKRLKLAPDLQTLLYVGAGTVMGASLGYLATIFESRKAQQYLFTSADISGLGFIFWLGIAMLMVLDGKNFLRQHTFPYAIILFYLSTYFMVEVTARIFESGLLLVLLAGLQLQSWRKGLFISAILGYGTLLWLIRASMPKMGFGIG